MSIAPRFIRRSVLSALCLASAWSAAPAWAQFAMVPSPLAVATAAAASEAESDLGYKRDAAKHLYASYPTRIYKGRLPPLLYGVAIVETDVNGDGAVTDVRMRRPPAAAEVGPWIVQMIRKAGPFPQPTRLGKATYVEVWLVHKGGNFQLDTLTEGQN